ncbi:MAG TPA: hemolysin family protein [Chryseosolibacter sp.]|nr:hemolysin family protein [Chryseosolibacter sp.]
MEIALPVGIIVSLATALFFSGWEIAFLSANKLQIEVEGKHGDIGARIITFFAERPTWLIGTTLTGNLLSLVLFSTFTTRYIVPVILDWFPGLNQFWIVVFVLTVLLTVITLYTIEFLTKSLFIVNANRILRWLAIPFTIVAVILFPVVYALVSLVKLVSVSILGLEYSHEKPVFGLTNVNVYLQSVHRISAENNNLEMDKKILSNVIDFKSVRVRECMVPRTEIVAVPVTVTIKELQEKFIESGHSKLIVYRDSIDDVVGYCHSSALFRKPSKIEEILTPIVTVPETTLANELMIRLINDRKSLAIVVDEFGGTSGMISMEDVIEEIFGEIEDEHDEDTLTEQMINEHTYLLSARLEIDYLNEIYGWNLPTGDYETLGGLILERVRDIPKPGETVEIKPYTFIVQATEETRINTVKMLIDHKYLRR